MNSKILSIVGALSLTAFSAAQACEISARVSVVGNEFPAIQTVGAGAAACTGAEVSTNLTADHQKINVLVCKAIQQNIQQQLLRTHQLLL